MYKYAVILGIYLAIVFALYRRRNWLLYYLAGSFGLTIIFVTFCREMGHEALLESFEISNVVFASGLLGLSARVLNPQTVMLANPLGGIILSVGIECSALLEMVVLIGLVGFYPALAWRKKVYLISIGVLASYIINLLRLLIILVLINHYGQSMVFWAHAVIGRLFFFSCIVILYWYLLTKPTLSLVSKEVAAR